MNRNNVFNAIAGISDDLIIEAADSAKRARRIRISKAVVLAAAVSTLLGMTVFASSVLVKSRSSSSSNIPDYYDVPSQKQLQRDIGINPHVIEQFSNGYAFKSGHISENEDYGEDGSVVESYKSLYCKYWHGDDCLSLFIDGSMAGIQMESAEMAETYKKSDIKYSAYTNKIVPGNYRLTEQDKEDQASGKYVFSFGSNEIEIHDVQVLGWEYGGLSYSMCVIDSDITKAELIQMAREIIDYQK